MQRLIQSLTGSSTNVSIQKKLTNLRSSAETAKNYIQFARRQPQFQNFESAAKLVQQLADETSRVAATIHEYTNQQMQTLNIPMPATAMTQVKDIINSAQASSALVNGGIQAARSYTYPEAIVHYTDQVSGTLDVIGTFQEQLVQLMSEIQALVDTAEQEKQAIQAQQQVAKRAIQAQQQVAKQAEHDRKVYLAQYGGIDPEEVIAHVRAGTYPSIAAGVITHKGETVLFTTTSVLSEDRTKTKYVGGSSGFSVPMGHGFRFRVGSYQGQAIRTEHLTQIDRGNLIITTQRIIFTGSKSTVTLQVAKVLHTVVYKNGVDIRVENRAKREVFMCPQPMLTNTFILIACHLLSA